MTVSVKSRILLIIGGGIAAYKALELIRRLRERGVFVRVVMTEAAQRFVTKLSVESLTGNRVYDERRQQWKCQALTRPPRRIPIKARKSKGRVQCRTCL